MDGVVDPAFAISMGKLGGCELNYSSDIDLIFLYDGEGRTDGKRSIINAEFFAAMKPTARFVNVGRGDVVR